MAIDSCDGNHLKRGSEMNPFDLFCIERSVFVFFYLDGELNHDGWHLLCMPHMMQLLLEMAKPYNDMFFVSFVYFECTENAMQLWIRRMKWKTDIFSISFTLVSSTKNSFVKYERKSLPAHTGISIWTCTSLICLSMMKECNVLKAFRTGVANKSEGDIMDTFAELIWKTEDNTFLVRTLAFEMFPRFSNTQTYWNKQTMSWCKDFLWRHVFLIVFLWSWQKDVNMRHSCPLFCVKEVTRQQETKQQEQRHLACLCGVKVAELWDRLTWFAWTVFCFLRTTSWTLTQVGLEVSKVRLPSAAKSALMARCLASGLRCYGCFAAYRSALAYWKVFCPLHFAGELFQRVCCGHLVEAKIFNIWPNRTVHHWRILPLRAHFFRCLCGIWCVSITTQQGCTGLPHEHWHPWQW